MNRRYFLSSAAAAPLAAAPASAAGARAFFELRWFRMRNGAMGQRTNDYLSKYVLPAAKRLGIGPIGCFNAVIAEQSPFVMTLVNYPSLAAFGEAADKMASDKEFQRGFEEYNSMSELGFIRMENWLLQAFEGLPRMAVPKPAEKPRIFELRTYESNSILAGKTKIRMFNEGEIAIFQRAGAAPVFFGETIVGRNLPNLTYMLSFEDMAAREKAWGAFRVDPEWKKMSAMKEYADALIVSNISNAILRPTKYSEIQ
jgi:hypothetical protein